MTYQFQLICGTHKIQFQLFYKNDVAFKSSFLEKKMVSQFTPISNKQFTFTLLKCFHWSLQLYIFVIILDFIDIFFCTSHIFILLSLVGFETTIFMLMDQLTYRRTSNLLVILDFIWFKCLTKTIDIIIDGATDNLKGNW